MGIVPILYVVGKEKICGKDDDDDASGGNMYIKLRGSIQSFGMP